jgi:tetratricopeptide (TPR) repeat protein
MFDYTSSQNSYSQAIKLSPKKTDLYLTRALINFQNNQLNEALADLKSCEELKSNEFYLLKAKVLKKAGQFNQAIENLEPIIVNDTAFHARLLKGQCLESIGKFEEAQIAYKMASTKVPVDKRKEIDAALKRIRNRVYELNRETDIPLFSITSPPLDLDKKMMIPKSNQFVEIKGVVNDKSLIKSNVINDTEADFERDSLNPNFRLKVNLTDKEYIKLKIVDIYSNSTEQNYVFNRAEKNVPKHKLFIAYSEKEKAVFFDKSKEKILNITGRVEDESSIKRIMVNDKIASFNMNESNPLFETSIDVSHADSIRILIIDEYENVELTSYYINSKAASEMSKNPMGKTWLVFIANSNYANFSTLTGPEKDLNSIRNTLLQYQFDHMITKYNMTLSEMEKFFRIELRDLVKEQGVNSIMIWFAGHGKYTNETRLLVARKCKKG